MTLLKYLILGTALTVSLCYAQGNKSPDAAKKTGAGLTPAVTSAVLQQADDSSDYIPCKFTVAQLNSLSNPELANVLSAADVESLISRVLGTVQSQTKTKSDPFLERFALNLTASRNDLIGKTPSEGLNTVLTIMARSKAELTAPATPDDYTQVKSRLNALAPSFSGPISNLVDNVQKLAPTRSELEPMIAHEVETTASLAAARPLIVSALKNGEGTADTNAIVDAAQKSIAGLVRPADVGCAMSILSYSETSKAYGRLIANEYIAVQVHIRNLNRNQEFVLHDAQFGVNADPGGRLGRYYSGRDKIIVRALSVAQQTRDPRNLLVHSVQGIGTILSAVSPIYNGAVAVASGVYNGAFATSLDKYWKDQTTDQLNLLNDTGFSSSRNSQTTVPKGLSELIVIFVPALPFTQGWWLLPCTGYIPVGTVTNGQVVPQTSSGGAGINVAKALEVCTDEISHKKLPGSTAVTRTDGSMDLFAMAGTVPYKKWSGNSLQIFGELSNAAVTGMHIVSDDQLQPSLTQLQCTPTDDSGNLVFNSPLKDTVTCSAKGANLDKFAKLRLRNASDLSDTATAEGSVTVSGDSTNATVSFQASTLLGLPQPSYAVFGVTANGVEQNTSQYLHLSLNPVVTGYSPSPLDFTAKSSPTSLALSGYHLSKVTSATLNDQSNHKVSLTKPAPTPQTDSSVTFNVDANSFKGVTGSMNVTLTTADGKSSGVLTLSVAGPK